MLVNVHNRQAVLRFNLNAVQELAKEVVSLESRHYDEVSIHFVKIKEISELHAQFFNDPSPTDCISFPMDDDGDSIYSLMGEIFVCPQIAKTYAAEHALDPLKELALYVVHGLLHLMGYDDIDPADRRNMRAAERRHLKNLDQKNLSLGL